MRSRLRAAGCTPPGHRVIRVELGSPAGSRVSQSACSLAVQFTNSGPRHALRNCETCRLEHAGLEAHVSKAAFRKVLA
eukprot:5583398-Alexandrium_andersonii.AAC.1